VTSREGPALWRRVVSGLTGALRRGPLGRSSHDYMKQFTGGDEYWDRVIGSRRGWPGPPPPQPGPGHCVAPGKADAHDARRVRGPAASLPAAEYEPVHGWTRRQLDEYLTRNPAYRPAYEAQLHQHGRGAASEVMELPLDRPRPEGTRRDEAVSDRRPDAA
jgi:hypothetical protein